MTNRDIERIRTMGHREFVGGVGALWDDIASLQFEFLKSEGLKPEHTLLDIACGSLRAGRLFINYLDEQKYLGIDQHIELIIHGVVDELGMNSFINKKPEFVISSNFEFQKFSRLPDYAIAQSLLTHLTSADIYRCFSALRDFVPGGVKFYATFFEVQSPVDNYKSSDSLDCFFYTREQMTLLADISGWRLFYIGDWGHPKGQKIIRLEAK